MIRDAREPRNTRAAGAAELEPTTSTSPSRHSTSSIASSQLAPWPTTAGAWSAAVSHPGEVQDRSAAPVRRVADDERHRGVSGSAARGAA
jgi:hypothetical protein